MMTAKKNHSKALLIFIIAIIVVFLVLPIGLFFGLIYDNHTKKLTFTDVPNTQAVGTRVMVDAFDTTQSQEKVHLSVTESDFDQLLYFAKSQIGSGASKYVKKFYCDISGNEYIFYVDLQASFLKTRILLKTTMNTSVSNRIELKIDHIKVGRIKVGMDRVKSFTGGFDLQKIFAQAGLGHAQFDNATNTLIYEVEGLIEDITKMMGNAKDIDFMIEMMNELIRLDKIRTYSNSALTVDMDLSSFDVRDNIYYDDTFVKVDRDIKGKIADVLGPKVVSKEIEEKNLKAEFKNLYKTVFVDSEPHDYKVAEKVTQKFKDSAADYLMEPPVPITFVMNEHELNEYLGGISLMGETYVVSRYTDDGGYKMAYMIFDNFYCKIEKDALIFVMTINVNGFPIVVDFVANDVDPENHSFGKIDLRIDEIKLGNENISDAFKERLYKFMFDALKNKSNETCLSMGEDRILSFNFVEPIQKGIDAYTDEKGLPRQELTDEKTTAICHLMEDHTLKLDVIRKTVTP